MQSQDLESLKPVESPLPEEGSAAHLLAVTREIHRIVAEGSPEFQRQWHEAMQSRERDG